MTNNPRTIEYENQKARKVIAKALRDVRKSHPEIVLSDVEPTKNLFVVHSCLCSAATWPDVHACFYQIDPDCRFYVFNQQTSYREYMFVASNDINSTKRIFDAINGTKPSWLRPGTMPFYCLYAENRNMKKAKKKANLDLKRDEVKLPGLNVIPNAISKEKNDELIEFVNSCTASETLKNRTVIHFGHAFDYDTNTAVVPTSQIPSILNDLISELRSGGIPIDDVEFDQVTINIYNQGQGIPSHVDTHSAFENQIVVISLLSDVVIRYKDCANAATIIDCLIPKNSVLLMQDAARYKYKHGIFTRRYDINPMTNELIERQQRISITYRKVRQKPCECQFPEYCDWDRGTLAFPKSEKAAALLESKYVSEVYENIASHFDTTRFSLWPAFTNFLKGFIDWSFVLDAGCGNGKYLAADFNLTRIGFDYCENLAKIASRKAFSVFRADVLAIPMRDDIFDGVICAAVLHHFSTPERRLRAFKEIARVLKPGGRALVSVWSREQGDSFYQKMRSNRADEEEELTEIAGEVDKLVVHDGRLFRQQDCLVPWDSQKKLEGTQFLRYYHLFVDGEMKGLVEKLENCKVIKEFQQQGNIFIEFEKC
ncbi:Alkylated DNA repair protein alkB-like protein 8 [Aphelenchoides bicaudatus]|nr:Alkylated DNA repair protein alkB-like protein 8 [Aphelenchoides bicaudatus]